MNKHHAGIIAGFMALTVTLAGCNGTAVSGGVGQKVATVNGEVITKTEYDKTIAEMEKAFSMGQVDDPEQKKLLAETVKQMAMNKLIMTTLVESEAEKAGIKVTNADVQEYKQNELFKDPAIKKQFEAELERTKLSEAEFDEMLKDNLLMNRFFEKIGADKVSVSEKEAKAFYDKNPEQFKMPERIRARHILVKAIEPQMRQEIRKANPSLSEEEIQKKVEAEKQAMKAKADKLYKEATANPAKFAELAQKNSDDTVSGQRGGELGLMMEQNIDPKFWEAIEKTQPGKFYPSVLATQFGYHIIQVQEHQKPATHNFEQTKQAIMEHLAQQKKSEFISTWMEQKKEAATINIEPAYQPVDPTKQAAGAATGQPAAVQQPAGKKTH